ncbi:CYTH domain-containing protein [Bradyrhizobium sp. CCBAU 51627]|uniref:CYTH domain-containing protein n=1 Tax=Bradyrhizobium sp. CCBAU 51627 TaxID=1325088 RepID=UPI003FA4AF76
MAGSEDASLLHDRIKDPEEVQIQRVEWNGHEHDLIALQNVYLAEPNPRLSSTLERLAGRTRGKRWYPAILTGWGVSFKVSSNEYAAVPVVECALSDHFEPRSDETEQPEPRVLPI